MKWLTATKVISIVVRFLCLTAMLAVSFYGLWLLTRAFLFDQFITPTESMMPTLLPGDRIIACKTLMGSRIYTDFDFHAPTQTEKIPH